MHRPVRAKFGQGKHRRRGTMEVKQLKTTRRGLSLAAAFAGILFAATASPQQASEEENSVRSSPKDLTEYARPAGASDLRHGRIHPKVFIRDVVVSNTDPTLSATDTLNDGETSITVNPANHDEIVITSFAGGWGNFAPLWHSTDGGATLTNRFTIPRPPGIPETGCPCDQTVEYGRDGVLVGTFLTVLTNVYSGATSDPSNGSDWDWLAAGATTAGTNPSLTHISLHALWFVNRVVV